MRSTTFAAAAFATAIAAAPAAAQSAASPSIVTPAIAAVAAPRAVASYRLVAAHARNLPDHVTVTDSSGTLTAAFTLPGQTVAQPMMVVVLGSDLVLQGETPDGVLTLELFGANDAAHTIAKKSSTSGRWHLDGRQGELRSR